MSDEYGLWSASRARGWISADLIAVLVLVVVTDAAVLAPGVNETPLRVVFGVAFAVFVPGYVFVLALFPRHGRTDTNAVVQDDEARRLPRDGIDGIERAALSFASSIVLTTLAGLALTFTPWGIAPGSLAFAITGFTVVVAGIAAVRRRSVPASERFRVPVGRWYARVRASVVGPENRADRVLNLLLVVGVILAASSVSYAMLFSTNGESFSTFSVLAANDSGAPVAGGYPQNFTVGGDKPVVVGIENHEHHRTNYSVVVELQRLSTHGSNATIRRETTLGRFSTSIADNETWHRQVEITPPWAGDRLRVVFLLYRGDPSMDTAYRTAHLWVTVSAPTANGSG